MLDYLSLEALSGDMLRELRMEAEQARLVRQSSQHRRSRGAVMVGLVKACLLALGVGLRAAL